MPISKTSEVLNNAKILSEPDEFGHWGIYGGRFVPETLMAPLEELSSAFFAARDDFRFH
ncbi:MAG: tryptophan synthase subunit beta, partial [Pyrinomonadaceae bacterium]